MNTQMFCTLFLLLLVLALLRGCDSRKRIQEGSDDSIVEEVTIEGFSDKLSKKKKYFEKYGNARKGKWVFESGVGSFIATVCVDKLLLIIVFSLYRQRQSQTH